ncbi:hypothetical protein GF412_03275 [Candidatus Micrarchaeota archaeon]|nr:hypothetical protein [Candidatus Micrarchaeota archaeon]MBD3417975.1 hypothetical protein [Candidatus Micrarchaeota archaeon]
MALVDFAAFTKKVLDAVKGKLSKKEVGILKRLFTRVKKRNTILAAGLLSALKAGGASKRDTTRLSKILETANERIIEGKKPFTEKEKKDLAVIFERANMPKKAEAKFKHNVETDEDDLLVSEIAESIHREEKTKFEFVPEKKMKTKTISLPEKKKTQQKSRRA